MQKKIIALAVAGLVSGAAFAQSNVEIYGNLDIGYLQATANGKTRNGAGAITAKTSTDIRSTGFETGALSSNYLGFRGSEDLGNGLKALFTVELGMNETAGNRQGADSGTEVDVNGAFAYRKQYLGLSGGFGTVTIGRNSVLIDDAWAVGSAGLKNNAVGDMYSTAASGSTNTTSLGAKFHDTRANELITYTSPNFSGFTGSFQYGTGQSDQNGSLAGVNADAAAEHTNWGFRADYANGPLAAVFAYNSEKNDNYATAGANRVPGDTATDSDSWLLGANYNFGILKVFGQYFDGDRNLDTFAGVGATKTKNNQNMSGWELGVHVPVTAQITLAASYYDASIDWKNTTNLAVVTKGDIDNNGYQLAGLYSLSKRTTAYVMYGFEESQFNTKASVAKQDADQYNFAVGLKHSF
jgi:predicted porin